MLRKTIILERIVILTVLNFSFKNYGLNFQENPNLSVMIDKIHENLLIVLKQVFNVDQVKNFFFFFFSYFIDKKANRQNMAEYLSESTLEPAKNMDHLNQNIEFLTKELRNCW